MKQNLFIGLLLCIALLPSLLWAQQNRLTYRWVFFHTNLAADAETRRVLDVMQRAQVAGYNGIVLDDWTLNALDRASQHALDNIAAVKEKAQALGLEVIPVICNLGYGNAFLLHNPNLAEGLPVHDALFVVRNGQANLVADPPVGVPGDFEHARDNRFEGWDFQDGAGRTTFADTAVQHGGAQSLRMENLGAGDPQSGNGRVIKLVKVSPYREYRLSAWMKTDGFATPRFVGMGAGIPQGRELIYRTWEVKPTQDWTQYHVVFNSLNTDQVQIMLGVRGGKGGKIWWDDAVLEEVGLLNVLRRPGCPLVVKGENGTVYEEGRDFQPVIDERVGKGVATFEEQHQPPAIHLTPGTRIADGERLRVSYFHPVLIGRQQVTCCLSEPEIDRLIKNQIESVNRVLQPKMLFFNHDEIRVINWCDACRARAQTPGQLLASNFQRCVAMARAANPNVQLLAWNDMFDPYMNAIDNYYLVNGPLADSWKGVPKEVIIGNWNATPRVKESMAWFAEHGYRQILAGYFDGTPQSIRAWLDSAAAIPGISGVIYETWQNRYDDLEAFAHAAWGQ